MRIAYARIAQETHAFSPLTTTMADFERQHLKVGQELHDACGLLGNEAPGWTPVAELSGLRAAAALESDVQTVPLWSAWALPSGPITPETSAALRSRLRQSLRKAGPIDGLLLTLHGAMRGTGSDPEPEEGILQAAREALGPDIPIAVTLDLHAQLTPNKVGPADLLVAYRTNPHWDLFTTGLRAGRLLIRTIRGQVRPTSTWRSLPMVFGGGNTIDLLQPMRTIFRHMKAMERRPGVLCVNLFMCHLWNDSPHLGWSVHVTTDGDPTLANNVADELADLAWGVRHLQPPPFISPREAIEQARRKRSRTGAFCMVDTSDVIGAGSTGENTRLLRVLLEEGQGLTSLVPLRDAQTIEHLYDVPVGTHVRRTIGGRLDPQMYPPLEIDGRLVHKSHLGISGRAVTLDLGHIKVVVTEHAPYNLKPTFFWQAGLNPIKADVLVVKSFFHFRIFHWPIMRGSALVRTEGLTDLDMVRRVPFEHPVHPFDDSIEDWRPHDQRRREGSH